MKPLLLLGAFLILFFKGHTQTTITDSILHESVYRSYTIHIPPGFNLGKSLPLVLVLHGSKRSTQQIMSYTGFNIVADTGNFMVVYPEAGNAEIDDVDFISSLIDTLHIKYNADEGHIYAAGIFNGGFMVQRLACQLNQRIAAVASAAAPLPDNLIKPCNSKYPAPIMFLQETTDAHLPFTLDTLVGQHLEGGEYSHISFRKVNDQDNAVFPQNRYGYFSDNAEELSFLMDNNELNRYDFENSAAEIWNFFKKHSLKDGIHVGSLHLHKKNYSNDFTAYPNPVQGSLFLSYTNGSIDYLEIFDHDSKNVFSLSGNDITYPIDVRSLPRGLYMLKVHTGDGETIKSMMLKD